MILKKWIEYKIYLNKSDTTSDFNLYDVNELDNPGNLKLDEE